MTFGGRSKRSASPIVKPPGRSVSNIRAPWKEKEEVVKRKRVSVE
jgi:hypothetical protein